MKFHIVNLGCKVNKAESDSICAHLLAEGNSLVELSAAETIIVNTCTVTSDAEKKTRKAVRRALRENDHAALWVTGCAAAIAPDFYRSLDQRVEIVDKAALITSKAVVRSGAEFPARVSVKVQDGCDHACTYCIVHVARGKARSRALDDIIGEVKALERSGIHEVVLSGIDLGSYRFEDATLATLLSSLLEATHKMRFRISSVEPTSLTPRTIELMAEGQGRICRHLHLPLQSGSSKVLSEMNRPYRADEFAQLTDQLYTALPTLALSTDIICGFPGESDQEFEETLALARHARFSKIHAFRYSMRQGTPAAERKDQIAPEVKEARVRTLLALADDLRREDGLRRIGSEEAVLIEAPGIGMSESYFKVAVPRAIPTGALCVLSLTGLDSSCMMKACKKR